MSTGTLIQDIEEANRILSLGADAIRGIGALLQPETADEQLNFAHRSEAAAVFLFLAEALKPAANAINDAVDVLGMEMRKGD